MCVFVHVAMLCKRDLKVIRWNLIIHYLEVKIVPLIRDILKRLFFYTFLQPTNLDLSDMSIFCSPLSFVILRYIILCFVLHTKILSITIVVLFQLLSEPHFTNLIICKLMKLKVNALIEQKEYHLLKEYRYIQFNVILFSTNVETV